MTLRRTLERCARAATGALVLAITAAPLAAQRVDSLTIGARVRLELLDETPPWLTGTFERRSGDSLLVRQGTTTQAVALTRVRSLAVHDATGSRGAAFARGFRDGALVGTALSLALILVANARDERAGRSEWMLTNVAGTIILTPPIIGTAGVIGGTIRAALHDEWRPLPQPW